MHTTFLLHDAVALQPDGVGPVPRPDPRSAGRGHLQAVGEERAPRPPQPQGRRGPLRTSHGLSEMAIKYVPLCKLGKKFVYCALTLSLLRGLGLGIEIDSQDRHAYLHKVWRWREFGTVAQETLICCTLQ